jgi:hypothetical protein
VDGGNPQVPGTGQSADAPGKPGQGTSPNPPSGFRNHYIIQANGKYYDPSYGIGNYVIARDYERDAFAGYFKLDINGISWLYNLPGTGTVCSYVVVP